MTFRIASSAARALCLVSLAAAWSALPADAAARTLKVQAHDLDLSTESDARRLFQRLERATKLVCKTELARPYSTPRRQYVICYLSTMDATLAQFDAPLVRRQYALRADELTRRWRLDDRSRAQ